jgi:hypothetical protein
MHDRTSGLIHIRQAAYELLTDSHCRQAHRSWKATAIIIASSNIHFSNDRTRETKVRENTIHYLKRGVTEDTLLAAIQDDAGTAAAFSSVRPI